MPGKPKIKQSSNELRRRAEKLIDNPAIAYADADARRLLQELDVYRIELELQNNELRTAREESEALLEKYTELYDYSMVGYFTLSSQSTILRANLTGSAKLGVGRSKLIGHSFCMMVDPEQRTSFKEFMKQVFASDTKQCGEFKLANDNLEPRIILIESMRSTNGLECSVMIQDITARIQAQERLRVSEIRYRRLFEAAHDGVLLLDPATNRIIDANPFMTRLLGYTHDELIGKELFEIGLLKDEVASRQMFRKLKKSHEVRYEDLPLESETGRHQEVEVVANLYQEDGHSVIQCNIRDITIRKQAEKALQHNITLKKEIVRRRVVEEDLRANRKEQSLLLRQSRLQQKQLRGFSHRILNIQEEERKRISRELHDVIAQNLVGIQMHLELMSMADAGDEPAQARIASTRKIVEDAVSVIHTFARELRPSMLDHLGLIPSLQASLKEFIEKTGIRVSLQTSRDDLEMGCVECTVLYRIAQEALSNIARHSKAKDVEISIEVLGEIIHMTIKDYGKGFVQAKGTGSIKNNRIGLIGMRERAEMIGGTFRLDSMHGGPTTVFVEVPVSGPA